MPVEIWEHEKRKNYPWAVDKLIVRSLKSGGRYRLRVLSKESGRALDERFFRNARIESRKNLRFALNHFRQSFLGLGTFTLVKL